MHQVKQSQLRKEVIWEDGEYTDEGLYIYKKKGTGSFSFRAQELCESRDGRPGLPVLNSPYGLRGRKATLKKKDLWRTCSLLLDRRVSVTSLMSPRLFVTLHIIENLPTFLLVVCYIVFSRLPPSQPQTSYQ